MKTLLVCEYREGKLLESSYELMSFADQLGGEKVTFLVGDEAAATQLNDKVYLADVAAYGEYNPAVHKAAILAVVEKEQPDYIVFSHSSYGWDLAPRVTAALKVGQVTEVVGIVADGFEVGCCNAKMRRKVKPSTAKAVLTVQAGAFSAEPGTGSASIEKLEVVIDGQGISFEGYEPAEEKDVDLSKAEVIVTAGRGVGKKDNIPVIAALAKILGGELGASRPVVDAEWVAHSHQVGTTGQTVSPKLYVACGVSGAIQHLAGMKKSDFVVAINKDKDAPIGEVADVLVVADVLQFVPALTAKLQG
ncbi:MAG: electron transfer flavoprotein subunit alpha/FixB family protein [Desulfuromonadales bacterium]|nr:electron transfer flavoprotein subunit alpha/FixB family protein [Desulfuromonadales bacterium]